MLNFFLVAACNAIAVELIHTADQICNVKAFAQLILYAVVEASINAQTLLIRIASK